MTQGTESPAPMPSHAAAKGLALGLGVLLLGGTALLITLLVTRDSGTETAPLTQTIADIELQAGEKVTDVTLSEGQALFLIEGSDGAQRVLLMDLTTGAREEIAITRR